MSRQGETNCQCNQVSGNRNECHERGSEEGQRLPVTVSVVGRTLAVSQHLQNDPHPGITAKRIEHVIEHWVIRGNCIDSRGSRTITYWGFAPDLRRLVRVAVSLDGQRIVTAYPDRTATAHWSRGLSDYFTGRCQDLEERDAGDLR